MTLQLDQSPADIACSVMNFQVEKDEFILRKETNNEGRVFFKFIVSRNTWERVSFGDIAVGDRVVYTVKPGNERSGIFIAVDTPRYDRNLGMVCKVTKFSAPPEETVTFQQIRHLCGNSGMLPVFADMNGNLVSISDVQLGSNGAVILKINC